MKFVFKERILNSSGYFVGGETGIRCRERKTERDQGLISSYWRL
jgi:hypothetical protein